MVVKLSALLQLMLYLVFINPHMWMDIMTISKVLLPHYYILIDGEDMWPDQFRIFANKRNFY